MIALGVTDDDVDMNVSEPTVWLIVAVGELVDIDVSEELGEPDELVNIDDEEEEEYELGCFI